MSELDLDALEAAWLRQCPSCDAGLSANCVCPTGDHRQVISDLIDEIRRLRERAEP